MVKFAEKIIYKIIVIVSVLILYSTYDQLFSMSAYGHDEVHYYKNFDFKLIEDGRWLNHMLLDVLKSISIRAWSLFYVIGIFYFFYLIIQDEYENYALSVVFASVILVSAPFVHQSLWPATSSVGVVILLVLKEMHRRKIDVIYIYGFAGISLFGTLQSFYFIVPLIFVGDLIKNGNKQGIKQLSRHLILWVCGAVIGVIVMSIMLWIYTNEFGVRPAQWRNIQPILQWSDISRNISYVVSDMLKKFIYLKNTAGSNEYIYILGIVSAFISLGIIKNIGGVTITLFVMLSFFAFSIPLAPIIQERSLVSMAAGMAYAIILICWSKFLITKIVTLGILLSIAINFSISSSEYLRDDNSRKEQIIEKIRDSTPRAPKDFIGIMQFNYIGNDMVEAKLFNSAPMMHGITREMGFDEFRDCRVWFDEVCKSAEFKNLISKRPFASGELKFYKTNENWLVMLYEEEK